MEAQNINSITLKTYKIVLLIFFVLDKDSKKRFFEKNFLLANVKSDIILGITFLTMSNNNIVFQVWDL